MNLETSVSPHIRARQDAQSIMWWVVIALLFPMAAATYFFGSGPCCGSSHHIVAVLAEARSTCCREALTVKDGRAAVTGSCWPCCSPTLPLWMAGIGAIVAVVLVKGSSGGWFQHLQSRPRRPGGPSGLLAGGHDHLDKAARCRDDRFTPVPGEDAPGRPGLPDLFMGNRRGPWAKHRS
jgi:Na+-transporting NADH:ubiquinone oxidoreductase subunit NqrB